MRLSLPMVTLIYLTTSLLVHGQEVISARVPGAAERIASKKPVATDITVDLQNPIQPLLGIRLLSVTTNSVFVASLASNEQCEMSVQNENIDTEMGIVQLKSVDENQAAAIFTLLKGLHRAWPSDSMLVPACDMSSQPSAPARPPQVVPH